MAISVTPQIFNYVSFDSGLIASIATELVESLGMNEYNVTITVDETTPLARTTYNLDDGINIFSDSGAFEDTRKPRQQSELATATSLGRVLLRARDRLVGGFGEAPPDKELSLAQVAAWETYSMGRLERLGVLVNQQRWRYNFRNRHGFTDAADAAFEAIFNSDGLTWGELDSISSATAAAANT